MNSLFERALRSAASALADALNDSPRSRPQQFTIGDRPRDRRGRSQQAEEELEQSTRPEEERAAPAVEVEPVTGQRSRRASTLRHQLRDREGVRRAFLLSEILDRPRAVRPHRPDRSQST